MFCNYVCKCLRRLVYEYKCEQEVDTLRVTVEKAGYVSLCMFVRELICD